ncbi:MAG: TRAP transporter large permease subunit [Gammaproteobacteria bacterium]|jgi:tripartite ATP-independent transporter DctM subunit|nr:TRAP transporter large permease subunit [Gammaproteobacteria bacterium]
MEMLFLGLLVLLMIIALTSGFPVAFSLPGASIIAIGLAALCGWLFADNPDAYFHDGGPIQWLSAGVTNFRSLYWDVERDTLIAIPLFIFMGIMLQRSKVAEDLLVSMAQLFGPVPGGLGISVVLVGALLAATTGIVGATVIAMGMISLPAMLRNNYSHSLSTGTICASGTLGQIIPPSIVLIILADQLSNAADQASAMRKADYREITGEFSMPSTLDITSASAGDMFMGAFIPGLLLVGLYVLYILITALIKPEKAPPVPYTGKYDIQFAIKVAWSLLPPLALIFVVLGSIILGIATVNQAGAVGAVGAMIMAGYRLHTSDQRRYTPAAIAIGAIVTITIILANYDINVKSINSTDDVIGVTLAILAVVALLIGVAWSGWRVYKTENTLHEVMLETAKTTSMVFIILIGAAMLTSAFRAFGGEELVKDMLSSLPGGFWMQFFVVMLVIFILGFFLDFIEIAVVVVPIVAPILLSDPAANVTAVWLGVMVGLNIQTSFLTPPFGFALFYLRGVADKVVKTLSIYKGVVPFIGLQVLALIITGIFPALVNYLPNRTYLTSESAPPPMNPRIQPCLEAEVLQYYRANQQMLQSAITAMSEADVTYLPDAVQTQLHTSLEQAGSVFTMVDGIYTATANRMEYVPDYAPLHREARGIEAEIRAAESELKELKVQIRRLDDTPEDLLRKQSMSDQETELQALITDLQATIPAGWESARVEYVSLNKAEIKARRDYRRAVDESYQTIVDLQMVIGEADAVAAALPDVQALAAVIAEQPAKPAMAAIKQQERQLGALSGVSKAKSKLSKARRALKGSKYNPQKARQYLDEAIAMLQNQVVWRQRAAVELMPALVTYDQAIAGSIGLRLQERMPLELAKSVSACMSNHKDISLNF